MKHMRAGNGKFGASPVETNKKLIAFCAALWILFQKNIYRLTSSRKSPFGKNLDLIFHWPLDSP